MQTCKTCRHWTDPARHYEERICKPEDQDTFELIRLSFTVKICKHPNQGFCETPAGDNLFSLQDGSNYRALLATAENFGCVLHELHL